MKKLILVLLLLLFSVISSCTPDYTGWKNIDDSVGTFKVPNDWIFTKKENKVYFTDKPISEDGYKIYFVGTSWEPEKGESQIIESKNVAFIETISSAGLSNSAVYGQYLLAVDGKEETKYFIY